MTTFFLQKWFKYWFNKTQSLCKIIEGHIASLKFKFYGLIFFYDKQFKFFVFWQVGLKVRSVCESATLKPMIYQSAFSHRTLRKKINVGSSRV